MISMLMFEAVLLLGVASCASTSANSFIVSRSKRDLITPAGSIIWSTQLPGSESHLLAVPYSSPQPVELVQAGTTVHTVPALDSTPGPTYSSHQRQGSNTPRSELRHRKNFPPPNLQGGFQAIQLQTLPNRVPQNNHRHNPSSYLPQASNHFQNKSPNKANGKSQYFQSPSSYRLSSEPSQAQLRSGLFPVASGTPSSFSKFPSTSTISGSNSGDHSFRSAGKYRSSPGSSFNPHHSINRPHSSSLAQGSYPDSKNVDVRPVSVQTSPEVAGFVREFENEPVVLKPVADYQARPSSSGFSYDHSKFLSTPSPSGTNSFTPNLGNYKPRVSSIHSPGSTPQIPQFQAASGNGYPSHRHNKPLNGYEQLINQPQLHFTTGAPGLSVENTHPIVYHSNPFEQIRTDVELINKKKTTTPSPFESGENDFDEAFKTSGPDFSYSPGSSDTGAQDSLKNGDRDNSFELPSSNLFSSYDEAFGKYSKLASLEQGNTEKRAPPKSEVTSKPVYQSIEEDDESADGGDKSSGEYRSSYVEGKDTSGSYEDEDEEESRRSERHGSSDEEQARDAEDEDGAEERSPYKTYGEDFEKEFEESYRQDLPKDDYVHVKQVPEIEESRSESNPQSSKRPRSKVSRAGTKQKTRYTTKPDYEKPSTYESERTQEDERPRSNYRDNEGHGTRASYRSTKPDDPKVKGTYGDRTPRDRGTARFAKKEENPATTEEGVSTKTSIYNVQGHFKDTPRFFSTTQPTLTSTFLSIEDLQTYTFPPFDGRKAEKKLTKDQESYGATRQQARAIYNPEKAIPNPSLQAHQGPFTYLTNGRILRDFSGI